MGYKGTVQPMRFSVVLFYLNHMGYKASWELRFCGPALVLSEPYGYKVRYQESALLIFFVLSDHMGYKGRIRAKYFSAHLSFI